MPSSQIRTQIARGAPGKGLLPAWPCGAEAGLGSPLGQAPESPEQKQDTSLFLPCRPLFSFPRRRLSAVPFSFGQLGSESPFPVDNVDGSECEQEGNCDFPRVPCAWTDHPMCPGPENPGTKGVDTEAQRLSQALEHLGLSCFHLPNRSLAPPGVLKSQSRKIPEIVGSSGSFPAPVLQTPPESESCLTNSCSFCSPHSLGHRGGWRQGWFR